MSFLRDLFGPSKEEIWRQFCTETGGQYIEGGFWKGGKNGYDCDDHQQFHQSKSSPPEKHKHIDNAGAISSQLISLAEWGWSMISLHGPSS